MYTMSERRDYNQRYYTHHRDYLLARQRVRYQADPDFKQRCRDRDRARYQYRQGWGGLLNIDPTLFHC